MKKLIFVSLIAALVLGFSSCKKNTDNNSELVGTIWVSTEYDGPDFFWTTTLSFVTNTTGVSSYIDSTDTEPQVMDFTYTYNPPTVTITMNGVTRSLTVDGDKMTGNDEDGSITFNKQ
jgi:hypothetical protein